MYIAGDIKVLLWTSTQWLLDFTLLVWQLFRFRLLFESNKILSGIA